MVKGDPCHAQWSNLSEGTWALYICYYEKNVLSQLSPPWLSGNSYPWIQNVTMHKCQIPSASCLKASVVIAGRTIYFQYCNIYIYIYIYIYKHKHIYLYRNYNIKLLRIFILSLLIVSPLHTDPQTI